MKIDGLGDIAFPNASVTVDSKFCIQNSFKAARKDGSASQTRLLEAELHFYPNYLKIPQRNQYPRQYEIV